MNLPETNSREEPFQKRAVIDNLYRHVKFLSVDIGDRYLWKESSPEFFGGINLSDNASFWAHGFRAVMVTDTSFFRNRHYHQESDTIDTLNFKQMAEVVKGLYFSLLNL
jgi:hypothetical protein